MATEQEITTLAHQLEELLAGNSVDKAVELMASIHPADQADIYARLEDDRREAFLALLSAEGMADFLSHLEEEPRLEIIAAMPRVVLSRVLDRMDNDEAADVLQTLPPSDTARVLANMATAGEVTPLLGHAEESAGGLMTRGFVALHKDMTAQQAVTYLRLRKPFAEEAYYLYVLDALNHLEGVVNLRELIVAAPEATIEEIMARDVVSVVTGTDQEECARVLQRYRLRALPVVDEDGVLNGIITADDLIDVITEEATEDMYRMAGLLGAEGVFTPVLESARRRIAWLSINMVTAFFAAAMVAIFEDTIDKVTALAVFMPIVAGQGGNAGIQTITIVVRGLALGEIELQDARRVLAKEVAIGVIKGITFGLAVGIVAWVWKDSWALGLVVGLALLLNMLVAGLAGTLIPLTLRMMRLDPAVASGVFVTGFTDVIGFLLLLGLATLLISQLT